jgi:hypothetical protein
MTEVIIGIIDEKHVSDGVSKAGKPYKRTVFSIGGKKFSTFDDIDYKEGDKVQFSYETQGLYNNIKGSVLVEQGNEGVKEEFVVPPSTTGKLKVKVITADNPAEFEKLINEANGGLDVKYTQTHVSPVRDGMLTFTAVLFYR